VIGPTVVQFPTLSHMGAESDATLALVVPGGMEATSTVPDGLARPEPVSVPVQVKTTVPVCQAVSALGQLDTGAELSIITPVIGPAVVQFPTASHTGVELVEAAALAVPAGAAALSTMGAWLDRPDPESVAEQVNETMPWCQWPSALGQVTTGVVLSIITPVIGPTGAQFPTLSQTEAVLVDTVALWALAPSEAVSTMEPCDGVAKPEPESLVVQVNETEPVCQFPSAVGQVTVGAASSIITLVIGPAVVQFPTASQSWAVLVETVALLWPAVSEAINIIDIGEPDPLSVPVQVNETVPVCQLVSAEGQTTTGAVLSIMMFVIGPAVVQLPARSQTATVLVDALALTVFDGMLAVSWTELDPTRPEPTSEAVQVKVTVPLCQLESAEGQVTTGATLSILKPLTGPAVVQLES
jgi:hypothetical protein